MKSGNGQTTFAILIGIMLIAGLFYWFQYRPSEIRKNCYKEVFSENTNLEWAEGKEWRSYGWGGWGWLFPYQGLETLADSFDGCLSFHGLKY